eukprot:scaffold34591_cov183-Amphora_coffeaeformis.AAC.1
MTTTKYLRCLLVLLASVGGPVSAFSQPFWMKSSATARPISPSTSSTAASFPLYATTAVTETKNDVSKTSDTTEEGKETRPQKKDLVSDFCMATNEFFKGLVVQPVRDSVQIQPAGTARSDLLSKLTAAPEVPGIPRPVWLTIAGSVPTALGVEEELFQYELRTEGKVSGCGGYGTLFPFVYGVIIGFPLTLLHIPLGDTLLQAASIWILAGQVNLYRRVNELCTEVKDELGLDDDDANNGRVLWEWWALLPPPLDV